MIRLDSISALCKGITPLFNHLFSLDAYGSYALLTGLICGYPMGAKITADLLREKKLSPSCAMYLFAVCNNVSPMFLLGYTITQSLQCQEHRYAMLLIIYGTPLIYAFFTKPSHHYAQNHVTPTAAARPAISFQMVDDSIMNGFETITRLGGYIILFAIISKMVTARLPAVTISKHLIIGLIEITNGIHSIGTSTLPMTWKIPLATCIISLGGLSGLAQTKSMIQGTSLSLRHYIHTKLRITVISTLVSVAYCQLFIA